jgi:hypothetical protein
MNQGPVGRRESEIHTSTDNVDQLCIDRIRMLSIDAVQMISCGYHRRIVSGVTIVETWRSH